MLLAKLLSLSGHTVETAYSGEEGILAALRFRPDAVISDINPPGLDGWEVAKKLRARLGTAKLIAVTGYYGDDADQRAKLCGFDHILFKPASPRTLLRLLARRRTGVAPHSQNNPGRAQ